MALFKELCVDKCDFLRFSFNFRSFIVVMFLAGFESEERAEEVPLDPGEEAAGVDCAAVSGLPLTGNVDVVVLRSFRSCDLSYDRSFLHALVWWLPLLCHF